MLNQWFYGKTLFVRSYFQRGSMLPNGRTVLCIQTLLIFPAFPPAVIGHLGKGPDLDFSFMCTLWPANLCITTLTCGGKDKIVLGWQAGNPSVLWLHFYCRTEQWSYWDCCYFRAEGQVKKYTLWLSFYLFIYFLIFTYTNPQYQFDLVQGFRRTGNLRFWGQK